MRTEFQVELAGPSITIQDAGRPGYARFGLSVGGAMDPWAMREGEVLLENPPNTAALEMAGYGGRFRVLHDACQCALTGAVMQAHLDGEPVPWRSSFPVRPGQLLEVGSALSGQESGGTYGYLHVSGGFDTPLEIGGRGTHLRAGIGGLDGGTLSSGACLPVGSTSFQSSASAMLPAPDHLKRRTIRMVWGPHFQRFSEDTRDRLLSEPFRISHHRDRMAMRLDLSGSEPFESLLTGLSDPAMIGDIQVTGDGFPAILMREYQPTGGYPRIATIITADLAAAAQLPTGDPFRFTLVTKEEAVQALKVWQKGLKDLSNQRQPLIRTPDQMADLLTYNLVSGAVSADGP